jgi:hypothetical protein
MFLVVPYGIHALITSQMFSACVRQLHVRADCLATNTEYCDRCTHAATQATNVARIKTEGTKGLTSGPNGWVRVLLDEDCFADVQSSPVART